MSAAGELARRFSAADPPEWNLGILTTVCNAVHFAHSRGILHRDLKPENVMIGAFGEVYVLDWGIAISLRDDPSGRLPPASQARDIAGTPSYMAPEMLLGDPAAFSARTDVYLKESLTKTELNRRIVQTLASYLVAQSLLGAGLWLSGVPAHTSMTLLEFAWGLTYAFLAVWVERWFALPALVCAASFVASSARPELLFPLMAVDSAVFTVVLVRVWLPKQDLERILERRRELRRRARTWIVETVGSAVDRER